MTDSPNETLQAGSAGKVAVQPVLLTERLILRPFNTSGDPDVLQVVLQCREIAANTRTIEHPYPDGAALKWIETHKELWDHGKAAVFAICEVDDPLIPVGAIGLQIDPAHEHAELGYWIAEPSWGKGYCSEAAAKIVAFAFSELGLHKIHAHHLARNPASGRVLEKIGMRREGHFRDHVKKWGVFEDAVFFGLLFREYTNSMDSPDRQP